MKLDDLNPILINEKDIEIEMVVDAFEVSYSKSCEHNKVSKNDPEYFRRYIFFLIASISKSIGLI